MTVPLRRGLFLCVLNLSAKREIMPPLPRLGRGMRIKNSGGATTVRVKITLACSECKQRNYDTMKNKKNDPDRIELNKFCKFCRKHTLHKETK